MLTYFVDNEKLGDANRQFVVDRAKNVLGEWPVVFIDYDGLCLQSAGRFTGYRVIALCSAFNPEDPDSIEYALIVFHQASARVQITPTVANAFSSLHWADVAEAVPY